MSDKSEDFLSFEKALRELQLRSEELKKLVSEGEIRAYRDGDSMKFRREDIASLASNTPSLERQTRRPPLPASTPARACPSCEKLRP